MSKILETFITILISVITIGIYNLVENVLRKNKKLSKVRQNRKTVIAVYDFFFFFLTASANNLFLHINLGTSLCPQVVLEFS